MDQSIGNKPLILPAEDKRAAQIFAKIVREGKIAVFPTETVYAIGCDATNAQSVKRVFAAKRRPMEKSVPVVASSLAQIEKYARVPKLAKLLAKKFMPGPLTLVVPLKKNSALKLGAKANSVAFRISSNAFLKRACSLAKVPIVATSANLSGQKAAQTVAGAIGFFGKKADAYFDAGASLTQIPSTIIDVRTGMPALVRDGKIPFEEILEYSEKHPTKSKSAKK